MEKTVPKLSKQVVPKLLICGGAVLCFVLFVIYPHQREVARLDGKIKGLKSEIEEQRLLSPIYQNLTKELAIKGPIVLTLPKRGELESGKLSDISSLFGKKAERYNLLLVDVVPEIRSLVEGSGSILVGVVLRGDFFDFRKFLIEIGKIPYLEHVEKVQIQPGDGAKEFRLKVRLALKKSGV